jgi:hypothetical protein
MSVLNCLHSIGMVDGSRVFVRFRSIELSGTKLTNFSQNFLSWPSFVRDVTHFEKLLISFECKRLNSCFCSTVRDTVLEGIFAAKNQRPWA